MRFNLRLIVSVLMTGMLLMNGAGSVSAAIVFSENFESIDTTGGPVNLVAGGTPNSAFGQNVAIVAGSGTHQIRAASDTTPFFSSPNNFLQFVDGGNGQQNTTGALSSTITGGYRLSFDFFDPTPGTDSNYVKIILSATNSVANADNATYLLLGQLPGSTTNGTAWGVVGSTVTQFQNIYDPSVKHHVDIVGTIGSAFSYDAGATYGAGDVQNRGYDVWIDGVLNPSLNNFTTLNTTVTTLGFISILGNNNNGLATLNFDNFVVETLEAVPEPGSYMLAAFGLFSLGLIRMKKRKSL